MVQVHLQLDVADSSSDSWGQKGTTTYNNLRNICDNCWKELLDVWSGAGTAAEDTDGEYQVNLFFLDHDRVQMQM